jgi:hypothetical protein
VEVAYCVAGFVAESAFRFRVAALLSLDLVRFFFDWYHPLGRVVFSAGVGFPNGFVNQDRRKEDHTTTRTTGMKKE